MADKLKDCSVVVVKLLDEILIRGTVKVYQLPPLVGSDESDSETSQPGVKTSEPLEKLQRCLDKIPLEYNRSDNVQQKLSVYTKINEADIITNVKCTRYRKRKLETEQDADDLETTIGNLVTYLVERTVKSVYLNSDINYTSPGNQEAKLVKGFCEENGFSCEDYKNLKDLFTFRTVPLEGDPPSRKRTKKRKARKEPLRKTVDQMMTLATQGEVGSQTGAPKEVTSGLDRIENENIRKILEDFGRLSKSQDSLSSNESKVTTRKTKSPETSHGLAKVLNTSRMENTNEKCTNRIMKTNHPAENSDSILSGSILKNILYSPHQNQSTAKDNEIQTDDSRLVNRTEKFHQDVIKETSHQTDQDNDYSLIGHCSNKESKKNEEKTTTRLEIQPGGTVWINDPNVILEKIQKLKKDIMHLDLLAEEKEKERIAILCFKTYKESVLSKIFANEAAIKETIINSSYCSAIEPCNNESSHILPNPVIIPNLIHALKAPGQNGKDPDTSVRTTPTYSSSQMLCPSFLQALNPQPYMHLKNFAGPEKKDDNANLQFGKCCNCDLTMVGSQYASCSNSWCCIPSTQIYSLSQNPKECQASMLISKLA